MAEVLPMTQVEILLKEYFRQKEISEEDIFSAEDLSGYIRWLMEDFGSRPHKPLGADALGDIRTTESGYRIFYSGDPQAFAAWSRGYRRQHEEGYIIADYDISVSRFLRYMPAHWHSNEYFEVCYVTSGDCPVFFTNETVHLKAGDVLITAPGISHADPCYADDAVNYYYMIRSSTFEQVFWNHIPSANLLSVFFRDALLGEKPNSYLLFETGGDREIADLMRRIAEESSSEKPYSSNLMNALMQVVFLLLLRRYESTVKLPRTDTFYWKQEFSALFSYIQLHYATADLKELTSLFHYSERQIGRIVKRYTGLSYRDLIRKLRMEQAGKLLKHDELSIEAIAEETGYSTASSFYRAFQEYYGCTPMDYKKRIVF